MDRVNVCAFLCVCVGVRERVCVCECVGLTPLMPNSHHSEQLQNTLENVTRQEVSEWLVETGVSLGQWGLLALSEKDTFAL